MSNQNPLSTPACAIYAGKRKTTQGVLHRYYIIAEEFFVNNGDSIELISAIKFNTKKKPWRSSIGAIHSINLYGRNQFTYIKNPPLKGYWKNSNDIVKWRVENTDAEIYEEEIENPNSDVANDIRYFSAEKMRDMYKTMTHSQRAVWLAKIIKYISM